MFGYDHETMAWPTARMREFRIADKCIIAKCTTVCGRVDMFSQWFLICTFLYSNPWHSFGVNQEGFICSATEPSIAPKLEQTNARCGLSATLYFCSTPRYIFTCFLCYCLLFLIPLTYFIWLFSDFISFHIALMIHEFFDIYTVFMLISFNLYFSVSSTCALCVSCVCVFRRTRYVLVMIFMQ